MYYYYYSLILPQGQGVWDRIRMGRLVVCYYDCCVFSACLPIPHLFFIVPRRKLQFHSIILFPDIPFYAWPIPVHSPYSLYHYSTTPIDAFLFSPFPLFIIHCYCSFHYIVDLMMPAVPAYHLLPPAMIRKAALFILFVVVDYLWRGKCPHYWFTVFVMPIWPCTCPFKPAPVRPLILYLAWPDGAWWKAAAATTATILFVLTLCGLYPQPLTHCRWWKEEGGGRGGGGLEDSIVWW